METNTQVNRYINHAVTANFVLNGIVEPTINFTVADHNYGDAPFTVAATSDSTGAFTYKVVNALQPSAARL